MTNLEAGWSTPPGDPLISVLATNVGSAITGLRVTLNDGRRIVLTVDHGWAIGWWPGISYPVSARVTAGHRTFSLRPPRPLWLHNHCASLRLLHLKVPSIERVVAAAEHRLAFSANCVFRLRIPHRPCTPVGQG